MSQLIDRHALRPVLAVPGLLLSRVDRPTSPSASVATRMLVVVAQGEKTLAFGDRRFRYGPGDYLIVSTELPVTGRFSEASPEHPFLGLGLELRPEAIAALLLRRQPEQDPRGRDTAQAGISVNRITDELVDALTRLLRLLDHPGDVPILAPLIEEEILWRLLSGESGELVRQIGFADSGLRHIDAAIRWIRDHHAEPLRVDELARLAGLSPSAFHRRFRTVTALSPIQFQKRIRLENARLRLVARVDDIAATGHAVGYDSPSQFSRDYRRLFGEPPGRDAARLRAERPRDGDIIAALP